MEINKNKRRLPEWLKRPLPAGFEYNKTNNVIADLGIETICTNANCPNRGQCWSKGTATVLILGNICTRNCKFCSVSHGRPAAPDATEPHRVAELAKRLGIKYLVLTSVTRDDLPDGGATQFKECMLSARELIKGIRFELLVPDFKNCEQKALTILADALPFVFGHNVETVPRLYSTARPRADYRLSLNLLKQAKQLWPDTPTKSSMMLGLGETDNEIKKTLNDLRSVDCDRVALGQYLKPSKQSLDVVKFITPEKFDYWHDYAKQIGFKWVMSSPFTRSSYNADVEAS